MSDLKFVHVGPTHVIAQQGGLLIQCWIGEVEHAACVAALKLAQQIVKDELRPAGVLVLQGDTAAFPGAEERKLLTQVGETMPEDTVGCAFVMAGSGFKAAAARAVMTGMKLLARRSMPVDLFPTEEAAIDWLAEPMGRTVEDMHAMIAAVRAELAATTA